MKASRRCWKKGLAVVEGWCAYNWAADRFDIELDGKDRVTGQPRKFSVYGDEPNFNGWKVVREKV